MNKTNAVQSAKTSNSFSRTKDILQRKCTCGNHTIAGVECAECAKKKVALQRKLTIGASNDPLEQEADRIADQVMAKPAQPLVSNTPLRIQRFSGQSNGHMDVMPDSVKQAIASPSRLLEPILREDMEKRFGYDFSQVRVHTGPVAEQSARDVNAHAYTVGQNMVFGAGRFTPGTHEGRRLIAHELTHVVQQSGAGAESGLPSGVLQRKHRPDALPAQPDENLVPLQGSEGVASEADAVQARAPEATPVPPSDSVESLGSPPLTDTSALAAQPTGPQVPPSELNPGVPISEALDATTDAGTHANATQAAPASAAPASDDSSMPRLMDLLSKPQPQAVEIDTGMSPIETASESVAHDEVSQDSIVERGALLRTLTIGAGEARKTINANAVVARSGIDWGAKKSKKKLEKQTKTADEAVRALANKRRTQIDKTILAHDTGILWLEKQCKENANTYASNAKKALTDGFGDQRKNFADLFDSWVRSFEKLNKQQSDRLTQQTDKNDKAAWDIAKAYDRQYIQSYGGQSEGRKEVQHDAVYKVAEAYSTEIAKSRTEMLPEIAKACSQAKPELDKGRDATLVEFDKGLPIILGGIDEQQAAAFQDISNKTQESRVMLAKVAVQMYERVGVLEETALKRNAAFRTRIEGQIESGRASAAQEFRRAAHEAMVPIAGIMDEAVGILTNPDRELDADASRQFIDEVVGFSLDAADATSVVFSAARDASVETLAGAVLFAKRGFSAGKQDLAATLHTEGTENESALIRFGIGVEGYLKSSLTALDESLNASVVEADTKLSSMIIDTRAKLSEPMEQTQEQIRQSVNDVLYEQAKGRRRLPRVMHNAARQAAWRYDHPILKHVVTAVEVVMGFALIVGALIALAVGLPILVGAAVAAVIFAVIAVIGGFFIGYFGAKAYYERRTTGASRVSALFSALAEVTGINDVHRAFTDPKMAPFDRGMAWGGFWLNLLGLGSGASRFVRVIKVRLPKKFTNPFRLRRSMLPTMAPEAPAVPKLPVTPSRPVHGLQPPSKSVEPLVSVEAPVTPGRPVRGFQPPSKAVEPLVSVEAPVTPSRPVRGFQPPSKSVEPLVSVEAPVTPGRPVHGFQPPSKAVEPLMSVEAPVTPGRPVHGFQPPSKSVEPLVSVEAPVTPTVMAEMPAPRDLSSAPPSQGGAQGARATAEPPHTSSVKGSTPETLMPGPVKGKLDIVHESPAGAEPPMGVQPPTSVAPKVAAEARVKVLKEESDVEKQLRSELGPESKEARELVAKNSLLEQRAKNNQKIRKFDEKNENLEKQYEKATKKAKIFRDNKQISEAQEMERRAGRLYDQISRNNIEKARLRNENIKLDDRIDRLKTGFPSGIGPPPGKPHGGKYKSMDAWGGERNHIPPESISNLPLKRGPAIWMEKADHVKCKSTGYSKEAIEHRAEQAKLIQQGKVREAVQMDIDDIKIKTGDKYEKGIKEILEYLDTIDPAEFIMKNKKNKR